MRIARTSGVTVEVDGDLAVAEPGQRGAARGSGGLPKGPIPMPAAATPTDDALLRGLTSQDMVLVDTFLLAPSQQRSSLAPSMARLSLEVDANECAVALLEQDGVYSWRLPEPDQVESLQRQRRGAVLEPARRRVTLDLTPGVAGGAAKQRGPVLDFLADQVRTHVFRFLAPAAVGLMVRFFERNTRTGPVRIRSNNAGKWKQPDDLTGIHLPEDRPARVLLFVHGTFSSTVGSFGGLSSTSEGRAFLDAALAQYDLVIGYDHRTLAESPLENAAGLLACVEKMRPAHPLLIDAVAFSRGALVLRSLIEYLLPASPLRAVVRRAVFVGGTNAGTALAAAGNWKQLVDIHMNLAAAGARVLQATGVAALAGTVLEQSIRTIGQLVKYLAVSAVTDRKVPGIAAMDPAGEFVTLINQFQPGQPTAADSQYFVIGSEFDVVLAQEEQSAQTLPRRLAAWIANAFADSLMGEPNDLVVNTRSMGAIDEASGAYVKDRLDFGRNPYVYHTVYFAQPRVPVAMSRWLQLAGGPPAPGVLTFAADDDFGEVHGIITSRHPAHVVVRRPDGDTTYHYAFRAAELEALADRIPKGESPRTLQQALAIDPLLEMHEYTASTTAQRNDPIPPVAGAGTVGRIVILDGAVPVNVFESPTAVPTPPPSPQERSVGGFPKNQEQSLPSASSPGGITLRRKGKGLADNAAQTARPSRARGSRGSATAIEPERSSAPAAVLAPLFFSGSMPEKVPLATVVSVLVRVSHDRVEIVASPTAGTATAMVDATRDLVVQVIAKTNMELVGTDREVVRPRSSVDCVFDVKGTHLGKAEVLVVFRQGAQALTTISLRPTVVSVDQSPQGTIRGDAHVTVGEPDPQTYPILQIWEKGNGDVSCYQFALITADGAYLSRDSKPIRGDRQSYVDGLYKQIEQRWLGAGRDFDNFQEELRDYGGQLWDELIPPDVQAAIWSVRDALRSIHVISEEPFIPWELVHLKAPRNPGSTSSPLPDQTMFLAQKGLVRWLHNVDNAPSRLAVRPGHAYYVIPDYPHPDYRLPAAQQEIKILKDEFGASPVVAELGAIRRLLREPAEVDLFHFAGHGEADQSSSSDARIMLLGTVTQGKYVPEYLGSVLVQQSVRWERADGVRPVVVLNACQIARGNWKLTSIGGFAEAFLRARAGVFVGSLWAVGDAPALAFGRAFYAGLKKGQTLADAAIEARTAARSAREATWLAYAVYGHPNARLS